MFSHQEVGKSSEKRGFYISLPKKVFTLHYAILCTTMDLSGSSLHTLCTYRIYYNIISSLYFICNDFSHFYTLLSQLFWFFKCYFVGFTSFYHYAALVMPFCTWLCFFLFSFALLMWKSLFSADNTFFAALLYIGISPIILFKNLTLFMCSNLLVRHYYLSYLCLYRLSLCKNKYVS